MAALDGPRGRDPAVVAIAAALVFGRDDSAAASAANSVSDARGGGGDRGLRGPAAVIRPGR
jgi:hypothetical protein